MNHLNQKKKKKIDNVGEDCPVFDGLYEFSSISAGGSMCKFIRIYIYLN